jgi:hypothetical protein
MVDLRTHGVSGVTGEPCVDTPDPWCSEVFEPRQETELYVAVKYKETQARPVRVQPVGCGCDDTRCENSRWRDGYEIRILTKCPQSHSNPPELGTLFHGQIPPCPPCPDDPWVVLAKVELEGEGKIKKIDNCVCRRLVGALGHFWWQCTAAEEGGERHRHDLKDDAWGYAEQTRGTEEGGTTSKESSTLVQTLPAVQPVRRDQGRGTRGRGSRSR